MSTPPEILFHRFFQREELSPRDRENYKGKQDLSALHPVGHEVLARLQRSLNSSLGKNSRNFRTHKDHPPFHFDYIESTVPNAMAFQHEGYSFIGVTMPLVYTLMDTSHRLTQSGSLRDLLGVRPEPFALYYVLFRIQLHFVVFHEYTHHVHGHLLPSAADAIFLEEIMDEDGVGSIEQQALEIDADGYAAYLVLLNLILLRQRSAIDYLKLQRESVQAQDEALLTCFIVAVGAFFFIRPPVVLDNDRVYKLAHPPQAERLNFVMRNARLWCEQDRPSLAPAVTPERFRALMESVVEAAWGVNGGRDWNAQNAFLGSADGARYRERLEMSFKAHLRSLTGSSDVAYLG